MKKGYRGGSSPLGVARSSSFRRQSNRLNGTHAIFFAGYEIVFGIVYVQNGTNEFPSELIGRNGDVKEPRGCFLLLGHVQTLDRSISPFCQTNRRVVSPLNKG